ncbi:MAG: hypothetical protein ABSD75_15185 [Terriglobales bacterium]|jgi:hypothetical protein
MATRRVIPIDEDSLPAQQININSNLIPSPGACIIAASGQQAVTFINGSGSAITITFDDNPISGTLFSSPINLTASGSGASYTQIPTLPNNLTGATTNYYISAGSVKNGPYAVQVGAGPMYIQFTEDNQGVLVNPTPVAIPFGGTLEPVAGDGNSYNITWPNSTDPFNPLIQTVDAQVHTEWITGIAEYNFRVMKAGPIRSPKLGTGHGGGTVKVQS